MRHTFLVVTVKRWLKSVYIYGSYRKIKPGYRFFGPLCRPLPLFRGYFRSCRRYACVQIFPSTSETYLFTALPVLGLAASASLALPGSPDTFRRLGPNVAKSKAKKA